MNKKIKAVVFDAGGVITEWRQAINGFLEELGIDFAAFKKPPAPTKSLPIKVLIKTEDYLKDH